MRIEVRREHKKIDVAIGVLTAAVLLLQWRSPIHDYMLYTCGIGLLASVAPSVNAFMTSAEERIIHASAEIAGCPPVETLVWRVLKCFSSGTSLAAAALILLVAALYSTGYFWNPWHGLTSALFVALSTVFFAAYGALIARYAGCLVAAWVLPRQRVKTALWQWPSTSVRELYRVYFQQLVLGTVLYFVGVAALWWTAPLWLLRTPEGQLWVIPVGVSIIGYFGSFHYATHSILRACKHSAEEELNAALATAYSQWCDGHKSDAAASVSDLLNWRQAVRDEGEWSLDLKAVFLTVATVLLPSIKAVLDLARR